MRGFKEKTFKDRLSEAQTARETLLERFRARPSEDDPEVLRRRQERLEIANAREAREVERKARRDVEAKARAEQEAIDKIEREAREKREAIERVIRESAEAADRKKQRDAKYAARKARQVGKR
jgi:hypothetical protein